MAENDAQGTEALPDGWVWTTIGEVCEVNPRMARPEHFDDDTLVSFVPMAAVDDVSGAVVSPETQPISKVWKGYTRFAEGDVIFAKITPCMENGKAAIAKGLLNGVGLGSTEFHVLRPLGAILPQWIYHFVRQASFREAAAARLTGTAGQLRVPASFMRETAIPLAPLPEQRCIVAAIETQFTRLDAGVAALARARANLRRYKAAVLKAACAGRLVPTEAELHPGDYEPADQLLARILAERRARWEAAHPGKRYVEPVPPDVGDLPALPEGWCWANVGSVFAVSVGGTPSRSKPEYWNGDIDWVSSGEVAFCRIKDTREKITTLGLANSNAKLNPPGTVLLAMIGEGKTRGQSAILDAPATNNQNAAAILCSETPILPEWVFYWFMARYEQTRRGGVASGGMQPALNSQKIQALPIALPPLAEQYRIVAEVERRLSVVAALEREVETALTRARRLRQSILKRAFEGRLVAQDPNDEPTAALLARIRVEGQAGPVGAGPVGAGLRPAPTDPEMQE